MSEEKNYPYIAVDKVQRHFLKFVAEEHGVDFEATVFYVHADTCGGLDYLHRDGKIRMGTSGGVSLGRLMEGENHLLKTEEDFWNMYTGYFPSQEEAETAISKYEEA